ncbi:family 20 glycosylhydrolase [Cellulomonas fengjieae]|uniref:beta-N-acetylhexosaminidase n=1 Tax=Cellulomonas fengjieae TaxID=2819978 RepID=A0ABS3SLG5_9CELL|nr:family 20 glycosylhydrolase [Cellulomonas fengjieae]MBO3086577.1 family 20 glycosylhydrolase [Cellulomonas fengjieae]QVI66569.1 family 20 glycosylhydrolase [Cellulomonas fengjieae]
MPDALAVIPRPALLERTGEAPFVVTRATTVVVDERPDLIGLAVLVADVLGRVGGIPVEVRYSEAGATDIVRLRLVETLPPGDEVYRVLTRSGRIDVEARTLAGLVRALVTLRQLIVVAPSGELRVPAVRIEDAPRYAWRGLSVDVARHFVPMDDLKVVIGLMAHYKLNVLHLHLTDDQGWRLDLPSRPLLTRLSSATSVGGDPGGSYSAADFADLVGFAAARGMRVVPEIDVPGHVNAATHAYGELNPSGEPTDTYTGIEVGFSRLHADLPATHAFLADVFADVAAMTPGEYVHIGGDEVLTMAPDEYATLVGAASAAVRAAGKKVVGWQEIAHTPLEPGTVVQYWDAREDPAPFAAAARAGALFLMSPAPKAYLDMKYDASTELGLEWAGHIELRDAYDWDPATLIEGVAEDSVIGVEAAIWTETLRDLPALAQMLLPRLAAIAEVAWSAPEQRDWEDFRTRVAAHAPFWDRIALPWHASPQVDWPR